MGVGLPLAILVCLALSGCVPTPVGRATPNADATGDVPIRSMDPTASATSSPAAGPSASPSFVRPTPRPSPTFLAYEVKPGDTLTSIARQFGTTARSIAYWNRTRYPSLDPDSETYEPSLIKIGWTLLLIPTAVVDEDELPELAPTPSSTPTPLSSPGPS